MGNMCENKHTLSTEYKPVQKQNIQLLSNRQNLRTKMSRKIMLPTIDPKIKNILGLKKPLQKQIRQAHHNFTTKRLQNNDIYHGQTNQHDIPHGVGKIFKTNGDLILSKFDHGVPTSLSYYISTNQVYYEGIAVDGMLNCQRGIIQSPSYQYEGGLKNNMLHGVGILITENTKFQGQFFEGKKKFGKLIWIKNKQIYVYQGHFNQNQQFTEKGTLIEPFGRYEGTFLNGMKHGFGIYFYKSELRYEGEYKNGVKSGIGKIFNIGDTLCYSGQFENGLPSGSGKSYKNNKVVHEGIFVQGVIELPQQYYNH